jgi:hypothetical protein
MPPTGPARREDAAAGPSRGGSTPAPTSRRAESTKAAAATRPATASAAGTIHHRSPANARIRCTQPIGETSDSHDGPLAPAASPAALSTKARATTDSPIARAPPEVSVSWAASAPTPANTIPPAATVSPKANAPDGARSMATSPRAMATATQALAPTVTTRLAVSCACLPTTVEPTSSRRPVSSSTRVWRITVSTLTTPMTTMAIEVRQATRAPSPLP